MLPYDEGAGTAEETMLIDFASTGVGLGMCDVAMLLAHSVSPTTLAGGGQERLIDAYLDALEEKGVTNYDRSTAMRHFHLATVDYARFVVSRMCFRHASHSDCFIAAVVGKCTASSERGTVEICVICGVSYRPTGDRIGA